MRPTTFKFRNLLEGEYSLRLDRTTFPGSKIEHAQNQESSS